MTDLAAEIRQRVKITEVAAQLGYQVQRSGFIFSPYHQEKTPSCKLYPESNRFWDYSCSDGGSVIDFWMAHYNCDAKRAIEDLASQFGIERVQRSIIRQAPAKNINLEEISIVDAMTASERELYEERAALSDEHTALNEVKLFRLEQNKKVFAALYNYCIGQGFTEEAWNYLTTKRCFSYQAIERFKLFEIRNYTRVNDYLKNYFSPEQLQKSGLYNLKEDGSSNLLFYKHRIILPYLHKGEIIYLRGRLFPPEEDNKFGKYLGLRNDALGVNTPKRFYNVDTLLNSLPGERLYIVEGEFDAMLMEDMGFNSIAIPGVGNSPSSKWFYKMKDLQVVVCPDSDDAGSRLVDHLKENFIAMGRIFRIKKLPAKDITEFVNQLEG